MDRNVLYERINKRVELMIEQGLIEEVTALKQKGCHYKKQNSLNTVGIKEVYDHLAGEISYERMLELIKQNTRRFAKRQMTWFNRDKNIKWVSL
jgi:tRNA dimethylallyltransferase